jgi:hypothetical protein
MHMEIRQKVRYLLLLYSNNMMLLLLLLGLGYEYSTDYCRIDFKGIDNIHTMRDSITKLFVLLNKDRV